MVWHILLVYFFNLDTLSIVNTEVSDTSSALGDVETGETTSLVNGSAGLSELEQLSHELANKGPPQSEVELR